MDLPKCPSEALDAQILREHVHVGKMRDAQGDAALRHVGELTKALRRQP
jgi:hypothetical protein